MTTPIGQVQTDFDPTLQDEVKKMVRATFPGMTLVDAGAPGVIGLDKAFRWLGLINTTNRIVVSWNFSWYAETRTKYGVTVTLECGRGGVPVCPVGKCHPEYLKVGGRAQPWLELATYLAKAKAYLLDEALAILTTCDAEQLGVDPDADIEELLESVEDPSGE